MSVVAIFGLELLLHESGRIRWCTARRCARCGGALPVATSPREGILTQSTFVDRFVSGRFLKSSVSIPVLA